MAIATIAAVALAALAVSAPRSRAAEAPVPARRLNAAAAAWLICVAIGAATLGLAIGVARIAAIDAGALDLEAGDEVAVTGYVAAVPTRSRGQVSVIIETLDGRLLARAPEPVADLPIGAAVRVLGTIGDPGVWEADRLARLGIKDVLATVAIEPTGGRRGGLLGSLDTVRSRAEAALGRGTPGASASLLRGFVLGQDDRIDAATVDDFKRSGLAHLLRYDMIGQNRNPPHRIEVSEC